MARGTIKDGWCRMKAERLVDDAEPESWEAARQRFGDARVTYWLALAGARGPHVRPVLAVWVDDALVVASGAGTAKARLLVDGAPATVTVATDGLDLVLEGRVAVVTHPDALARIAAAYREKYDWTPDQPGAPTAGPPPYDLSRIEPARAFGFPYDDAYAPTRWTVRAL